MRVASGFLFSALWFVCVAMGQTETAAVSGLITDEMGAVVPGAEVKLQSVDRGTVATATTNDAGIYVFASVHPGQYQVTVHKPGFKQVDLLGMIVNVQDHIEQNFRLQIGSVAESVTVNANDLRINTTDATVSTVVDRQFAENLPMNGRSFQTLIQLTPGVVLTPVNSLDSGQFSVNGQRPASNYWMVDGVSANVGIGIGGSTSANGLSGANAAFSVLGGTNSLVSVDAMQEFRIQTSTFAPEFGRTPGAQISIVTRSGTSHWHGTAFDYLRNDKLDANDWFANFNKLSKPEERQNDFGGTFSGPILKERTFFFFSYEGLRLRLPQVGESLVPDLNARQTAIPAMQPYLNAFPLPSPNTLDDVANGIAHFNASYSNASSLDAYSLRVDHKLNEKLTLFGRYNFSPSSATQRNTTILNNISHPDITIQTGTIGTTWTVSPASVNDLRFNYSRTRSKSYNSEDGLGGAVPLASLPFPSGFNSADSQFGVAFFDLNAGPNVGLTNNNLQRQINLVDNLTIQKGSHALRFGLDFRRLSPTFTNPTYTQIAAFLNVPSSESGNLFFASIVSTRVGNPLFHNLGVFGQDTWRIARSLTLTYGLRWDVDFAPSSNPSLLALTGFKLSDLSSVALAPGGTPPFHTTYDNFAPRIGIAYQVSQNQNWQTVLRGGFGVFFDMATSEAGNIANGQFYPFGATNFIRGSFLGTTSRFPLSSSDATPPSITPAVLPTSRAYAFDPNLKLPYTLEWNIAVEQALGPQQTLTTSYIGSAGRRLLQTVDVLAPNANFGQLILATNATTSDYNSLQVQFQRRLSRGLQALASYTFSHSIDTASAGSFGSAGNAFLPSIINQNRGPSDFDIRHAFSVGLTYDILVPRWNSVSNAILRGWSLQNVFQARSAPPVNVGLFEVIQTYLAEVRPDVVPGQPLYLYGSQYPGGKAFNCPINVTRPECTGQFSTPPAGQQGNLGRNTLRGFGAWQWDFALHRDFPIHESLKLQFRAEMFNILNHPNFAPPLSDLSNTSQFGLSTQTLGSYLAGGANNLGGGGFSSLYQIGGSRSLQLALKLQF